MRDVVEVIDAAWKAGERPANEQQEDHGDPASAAELPSGARGHGGHAVGTLQELREATQRNGLRDDDLWRDDDLRL